MMDLIIKAYFINLMISMIFMFFRFLVIGKDGFEKVKTKYEFKNNLLKFITGTYHIYAIYIGIILAIKYIIKYYKELE